MNKSEDPANESPTKRSDSAKSKKIDKPRTATKHVKEIFGKLFTRKILSEMKLKIYNFSETEHQIKLKADFKQEMVVWYKT